MKRVGRWPLAVLMGTAAAFTLGVLWRRSWYALGQPSYDIYGFFYPNQVYGWQSVRDGAGLLWNRYQDCGQPFFGMSQVGFLYPVNVVFALLDREPALLLSAFINLVIAGAGTFLLGRSLGLSALPALSAALAFQLGWVATWLASWSPIHIASLAWMPIGLWRTEHLIDEPSGRPAIALGAVLTVAHLPGFYQTGFFLYQLILLRVAWACITRRARQPLRLLSLMLAALALPLLLGAVQLWPSIEVALHSLRGLSLDPREIGGGFSWAHLGTSLVTEVLYAGNAVVVVLALVALLPSGSRAQWDSVLFFWAVAVIYFILSLGPGSPLYRLYERLPLGSAFRGAWRLVWVTNLAMAVLAGWGAEVLGQRTRTAGRALRRGLALIPVAICLSGFFLASYPVPMFGLRRGDLYAPHVPIFTAVRERLTPQDRVFIAGGFPDFALMPKSASLFHLPSIFDFETQAPRAYVEFFTYMRTGRRLQSLQEWYWSSDKLLLPTLQRRMLDVSAARYVITNRDVDRFERALRGGVRLLSERDGVRVYENQQALARARYVPRVVVAGEDEALAQLAASPLDPRAVAWVPRAPRSGFLGADGAGTGSAAIERDESERVTVRVHATQPGFLFLADQYYPGWSARVNGAGVEILPANVAFRLVEVPAGESEVVFVYRPLSVHLGALVSLATLAILVLLWYRSGRSTHAMGSNG